MSALTKPRNTKQLAPPPAVIPSYVVLPIADNVKIYPGSLVVLDGGYLKPATAVGSKIAIGRASSGGPGFSGISVYDNTVTGHAAGALNVPVDVGCFKWANKSGDEIVQAGVGGPAWIENDQTVRATSTSTSCAGRVVAVESDGVWVLTFPGMDPSPAIAVAAVAAHQADSAGVTAYTAVTNLTDPVTKAQGETLSAALATAVVDMAVIRTNLNALLAKLQAAGLMA